jgi:CRISPR-associated protein Csd2
MTTQAAPTISRRYDFVVLFDVQDGNPNGDPDAGNLPRIDPETGQGLVTDVCLKRKIRNYVLLAKGGAAPYDIFVKEKAILNQAIDEAHAAVGTPAAAEGEADDAKAGDGKKPKAKGAKAGKARASGENVDAARLYMCDRYFDVRTFGAVMSTGQNAGQVRGPVQMTFARSIDPIVGLEHSITRMAVATVEEAENQKGDNRTMGRKSTVPYGLYRAHGFVSPGLAQRSEGRVSQGTGFSDDDLALLWTAIEQMFEHDRSAARGLMSTRALVIFEHGSALGDAPAFSLFDRVRVQRSTGVKVARSYADYEVTVDGEPVKGTVTKRPAAS